MMPRTAPQAALAHRQRQAACLGQGAIPDQGRRGGLLGGSAQADTRPRQAINGRDIAVSADMRRTISKAGANSARPSAHRLARPMMASLGRGSRGEIGGHQLLTDAAIVRCQQAMRRLAQQGRGERNTRCRHRTRHWRFSMISASRRMRSQVSSSSGESCPRSGSRPRRGKVSPNRLAARTTRRAPRSSPLSRACSMARMVVEAEAQRPTPRRAQEGPHQLFQKQWIAAGLRQDARQDAGRQR